MCKVHPVGDVCSTERFRLIDSRDKMRGSLRIHGRIRHVLTKHVQTVSEVQAVGCHGPENTGLLRAVSSSPYNPQEKLQTGIEQRALPILEQLRHEQTDFLSDYNLTMNFFQFVSHQYMRTRAVRERVGEELRHSFPGWDFGHLKHLVCHCAAENIGASLFVDRSKFQIIFLRNGSKDEFITGDQPIVNLFRSHGEDSPPTELALYYPLNPHLSMILLPGLYGLSSMKVPPPIVDDLNNVIAQKAREFIVAKGIEAIQRTTDGLHEGQEQDGHVLLECIKRMATERCLTEISSAQAGNGME